MVSACPPLAGYAVARCTIRVAIALFLADGVANASG
jgi:hypothetical protein